MQRAKKPQHTQSTNKFMKSKYLDTKKPTIPSSNKIMLTDLCPQEKAKIGQLIKTLEQRKKQNQDLQQQLTSWKSNYITLDKVKTELQNLIQTKNHEMRRLSQQLNKLNVQKIQKDIEMHQITIQLQKYKKKENQQLTRISYATNTNTIQSSSQQTQTREKKKKHKDRQVQVNTIQYIGGNQHKQMRKNNFYQPNSKSFDKIMKGQRLLSSDKKNYQTAAFRDDDHFDEREISLGGSNNKNVLKPVKRQSNIQQFYGSKELRASQLQENQKNWSEYGEQVQVPNQKSTQEQIQVEDTQNDDDEFQMLAKKWLQLKEKNIQQLSQGYFVNNDNQDPSMNVNLKSLGIQSKLRNPTQKQKAQENQQEQEVDEEELNRALRSKDFSASRLLNNSRSKRNISQHSDKKSLQNSQSSYRNVNSKNQQKPINTINRPQYSQKKGLLSNQEQRNPPRPKYSQQQSSRGIDFYSVQLLDLVEEINK